MAGRNTDLEQDEKPLDPAAERVRQKMVRFMAINLGILFFAVMVVILAVVYRNWNSVETPAETASPPIGEIAKAPLVIPRGARVISQSLTAGRLSLHVGLDPQGEAILVYELPSGRLIGQFDIVRP
ncbi:MAG: fimbrial protein [Pseudomonadota bacterium]